jgi:hypothetical protein
LVEGPRSTEWAKLSRLIPPATFARFAERAGLKQKPLMTWQELREQFEAKTDQHVRMKDITPGTADIYKRTCRLFVRQASSEIGSAEPCIPFPRFFVLHR